MVRKILRLIVLTFFILVGCTRDNSVSHYPEQSWNQYPDNTVESITLLIHNKFTNSEKGMIAAAAQAWQYSSNNKIRFVLIWDQPVPAKFYEVEHPATNQGIFVWKLKHDDSKHLTKALQEEYKRYRGLFITGDDNSGHIILFIDEDNDEFYSVVTHEFGHLLGVEHLKGKDTIMHSAAGSKCITIADAKALCKVKECIPRSSCDVDFN